MPKMAARSMALFTSPWRLQRAVIVRHVSSARKMSNEVQKEQPSQGVFALLKAKTGNTGKLALGIGVGALLLSKEIYVVTNETIVAAAVLGTMYALVKKIGRPTAEYLDNRSQEILDNLNAEKNVKIKELEADIAMEQNVENVLSIRSEIFEIMKEKDELLREEEYRRRLADARAQVKKRLDYQLQMDQLQKQFQHKHVVSWLEESVRQALQSKSDESIPQCISNLKTMAATS